MRAKFVFLALALLSVSCGKKPDKAKDKDDDKSEKSEKSEKKHKKGDKGGDDDDDAVNAGKPQSTGKEMPVAKKKMLSVDEARKLVADGVAEFKKTPRDCAKVLQNMIAAIPVIEKVSESELKDPLIATVHCAESTKRYSLMRGAAVALASAEPNYHPAMLPRAELYLGNSKAAFEQLKALYKKTPNDPEIAFTASLGFAKAYMWPDALKAAEGTVKLANDSKNPVDKEWLAGGHILRYASHLHLGEIDKADKAIADMEKISAPVALTDGFKKILVPVKSTKVLVEPTISKEVYLGTYHLLGKAQGGGNLVDLDLSNFTGKDQQFKVEIEMPGVTEKTTKSVSVLKGKDEWLHVTPAIATTFDIAAQRAVRKAAINVKVSDDTGKAFFEQSYDVELQPRDTLPLVLQLGDVQKPTNDFIAAWVTPNAKAVEKFITDAKKRLPKGSSFSGPQSATMPQVKAIYDELKARGYSYVMDPPLLAESTFSQRTRLPSEVLKSTNAQCIEGAILFATLIEAIGVKPYVIRIPGHAFVGWELSPKDGAKPGTINFVETTAVHDADFDGAVKYAQKEFDEQKKTKAFEQKRSFIVDIGAMRAAGITPQPFD